MSSAWPWTYALGSLSTYTTRTAGLTACAIWWVFCTVGRPEPRSRNWATPSRAMNRTARPSAARLSRAPPPPSPIALTASAATARSTAKLSLPPRIASYTRATLGLVVSTSGGTYAGSNLVHAMSLSRHAKPSPTTAAKESPRMIAIGRHEPRRTWPHRPRESRSRDSATGFVLGAESRFAVITRSHTLMGYLAGDGP